MRKEVHCKAKLEFTANLHLVYHAANVNGINFDRGIVNGFVLNQPEVS